MQTVSLKMKAGDLKKVIDLPNFRDDQHVKVTVSPDVEPKKLSKEEVQKIISDLAGCLSNSPDKNKSLDEIRYERIMNKYESLH